MPAIRLDRLCATLAPQVAAHCAWGEAIVVTRACSLTHPVAEGLGFIAQLAGLEMLSEQQLTQIGALVVTNTLADHPRLKNTRGLILCAQPNLFFAYAGQWFEKNQARAPASHHPSAHIAASAQIASQADIAAGVVIGEEAIIGENCRIGAHCVIGDRVRIGADSVLHPHVTIYANCQVGERALIHSGAIIGSDGFGFVPNQGQWVKMPHTGQVVVGNDVEIGANTTIDRATLDATIIGDGVKLDNQIHIGHNCSIGPHTAIAGCVGIAGSTHIGARCQIGGAAMIQGHIRIADDTVISSGSFVFDSIEHPGRYTGIFPTVAHKEWQKNAAVIRSIESWRQRIKALEQQRPPL